MANGKAGAEATVIIDGVMLTNGQAMTLRVALSRFADDMSEHGALGCDGTGELLRDGYLTQSQCVLGLMIAAATRNWDAANGKR